MFEPPDINAQRQRVVGATNRTSAFLAGYLRGLALPLNLAGTVVSNLARIIKIIVSFVFSTIALLTLHVGKIAAHVLHAVFALITCFITVALVLAAIFAIAGALLVVFSLFANNWPKQSTSTTPSTDQPIIQNGSISSSKEPSPNVSIVRTLAGPQQRHTVEFVVFSQSCNWPKGDTELIICGTKRLAGDAFVGDLLLPHIRDKLLRGTTIVSIGAASSEGDPEKELPRSLVRANKLASWMAPRTGQVPIWVVSLGQFSSPCSNCYKRGTDWQRPLIVALITETDPTTDIAAIIRAALSTEPTLPDPSDYVGFASRRWR